MIVTEEEMKKVVKEKLSISITLAVFMDVYLAKELEKYSQEDRSYIVCKLVMEVIHRVVKARKKLEKANHKSSMQEILFNLFNTLINNRELIAEQIPDIWLRMVKKVG